MHTKMHLASIELVTIFNGDLQMIAVTPSHTPGRYQVSATCIWATGPVGYYQF